MLKYISLVGAIIIFLVFGATIMTTIRNPTASNILVSCGLFIFGWLGIIIFARKPKYRKERTQLPIEEQ